MHDVLGRRIATLVDRADAAGADRVVWNGRDAAGRAVVPGVYLVRLESAGEVRAGKIARVR